MRRGQFRCLSNPRPPPLLPATPLSRGLLPPGWSCVIQCYLDVCVRAQSLLDKLLLLQNQGEAGQDRDANLFSSAAEALSGSILPFPLLQQARDRLARQVQFAASKRKRKHTRGKRDSTAPKVVGRWRGHSGLMHACTQRSAYEAQMDLALTVLYPAPLGSRAAARTRAQDEPANDTIDSQEQAVLQLERALVGLGDLDRLEFSLCTFVTDRVPTPPSQEQDPASTTNAPEKRDAAAAEPRNERAA